MKKYIPFFLAILVLIGAYFYGQEINKMDEDIVNDYYAEIMPEASSYEPITDKIAKALDKNGNIMAYIGISSNIGYAGPVFVGTIVSPDGGHFLSEPVVLTNSETPAYLEKIKKAGYFTQYEQLKATDSLLLNYDINAVSGATLSSRAIANSVRDVAHSISKSEFGINPETAELKWNFGIGEISVLTIFILGIIISSVKKLHKYRMPLLMVSMVILGFILNRSLTVSQFSSMFLGFFPPAQTNLLWYIVVFGAILPPLIAGKNVYCSYICPFCGLQEITHLVSHVNVPLGRDLKLLHSLRNFMLLAVLIISFLTVNASIATYEPFGTIFGFNGSKYSWYLLFIVLAVSFIFKRFWCNAFCPVGAFLDLIGKIRREIGKLFRGKKTNDIKNAQSTRKNLNEESAEKIIDEITSGKVKEDKVLDDEIGLDDKKINKKNNKKIELNKTDLIILGISILILICAIMVILDNFKG